MTENNRDINEKWEKLRTLLAEPYFKSLREEWADMLGWIRSLPEEHGDRIGQMLDLLIRFLEIPKKAMDECLEAVRKWCEQNGQKFNSQEELAEFTVALGKKLDEYLVRHGEPGFLSQ